MNKYTVVRMYAGGSSVMQEMSEEVLAELISRREDDSSNRCKSRRGGFICTCRKGHKDIHIAHTSFREVVAVWGDEGWDGKIQSEKHPEVNNGCFIVDYSSGKPHEFFPTRKEYEWLKSLEADFREGDFCGEENQENQIDGYVCTRPKGHNDFHMASNEKHILEIWKK